MKNEREIIITENGVYQKIRGNDRFVISNSEKNEVKNENETVVDKLGRIQLAKSIRKRMKLKDGEKLDIYRSGRSIILKKLIFTKSLSRETQMIIDNKYEVKVQLYNLDFDSIKNHQITTIDEFGNVLVWNEIRKELGIIENSKLKISIKDDMIILTKKEYDKNNKRKRNFNNNRRRN